MTKYQVDLYYDVISPYSWIAFEGLLRYEKIWPISVQLKPFVLKDVMMSTGNKPPMTVRQKGLYMLNDLERNNDFWGMELNPPAKFAKWVRNPATTTENAMKVLTAIGMERPDVLEKVTREYWKRIWTEGEPIFSDEDHSIVLKAAGVTDVSHFMAKMSDPKVAEKLKENTETAVGQGCFGAPWIVVHKDRDEHGFFGSDRFSLIGNLIGETFTHGQKQLSKL